MDEEDEGAMSRDLRIKEYILAQCRVDGTGKSCLLWRGRVNELGYPIAHLPFHGSEERVDKVLWELSRDRSLAGLELRHGCSILTCVNPDHMYPIGEVKAKRLKRREREWYHWVTEERDFKELGVLSKGAVERLRWIGQKERSSRASKCRGPIFEELQEKELITYWSKRINRGRRRPRTRKPREYWIVPSWKGCKILRRIEVEAAAEARRKELERRRGGELKC